MLKYINFLLIKPNLVQRKQITKVIEENYGSVFHEIALNEIVASQFNTDLYYMINDPNNIKVLSPVHKEKLGLGRILYHIKPLYDIPYSGFVGDFIFDLNKLSIGFFDSIKYAGFPFKKNKIIKPAICEVGETAMVDLSLSEEEIFTKVIHAKRRNMIRKANTQGIIVKKYFSTEGLIEFWPILKKLHDRLGYTQLTFDYFNNMLQYYGPKNQAFILVAYNNGIAISGVFILGNKNYMHYYKGASLFDIKNEGHGELLQWEAIKLSKSLGSQYYDLCNLDKEILPDIYKFKTGISKEIYQYPIYSQYSIGFKLMNRIHVL